MTQITRSSIGLFCCVFFLPTVLPASIYNMDEPSTCNQRVKVYETPIIVNARKSTVTPSNPSQYCDLYLEASSTDNAYRLQIIIKSVAIKDSAFRLRIIDGSRNGNLLRQLGHGSKTTDMIVTKSSTAVLSLYRPNVQYHTENDFSLEIKGYRDPDEPDAVFGGSRLAPGAIIGIIIAALLLIAFAFALCYMYNTGILTGKRRRHGSSKNLTKVPLNTNGSMVSVATAGSGSVLGEEKTNARVRSDGGGQVNRAYNALVLNSMLATSQGKLRSDGEGNGSSGQSISRGSSINIADRPALTPPNTLGRKFNRYQASYDQGPDAEYLEPVNHRRSGRLNTVTFDTEPSHFQRSFKGGPLQQHQQQSPHGSRTGAGSQLKAHPDTDRHSGRSVTSYNEIKQLPDLVNGPEGKARLSDKSRSPRGSGRDQSPKRRTSSYRYNPSTENDKNATEPAGKTGTQQHDDDPLSQTNKNSRSRYNQSPTTNGQHTDDPAYAQIQHKEPSSQLRDHNSTAKHYNESENKISEGKVPSRGYSTNRVSITEEELQEEIQKRQEQKQEKEKRQSKNGSDRGRSSEGQDGRRYGEDEEDENDLEVKHFHTFAGNGTSNSNSIGNSFDFETEDEEPRQMTNPVVNNAYMKKSMQDPTLAAPTRKSQTKPSGRRDDDDDDDDVHSRPVHPHFGIPDLVQNSSDQNQSDPYYSGFPTAFNEIVSRTVNPDPNKTFAYGYHSHSDPHREDSVSGKAAWYMESTPTKSGPINTTAFFMQTSQPSQRNEDSPQPTNTPPSAFRTVNGMGGNRLPPEYTSTPADPYAPAASSSPKSGRSRRGEVVKPKPRSRKSLPSRSGSPPRKFPLSIPDPHAIDGISAIEPGQRSAMVRSGFDPTTGCQTSQVMWAEKVPDPTDPGPGDNARITRKTINRITTRSTYDQLPDNPFPLLAQMHAGPSEPSFLSPSGSFQGGIGLLPRPEEISFYTQNGAGTAAPVIHEAPNRSKYIKDSISFA